MNEDGIHAQYEANGKTHDWNIKNRQQFNALSAQEQLGYQSFRSADGKTYHAKHLSVRAPSESQRQQADLSAAMQSFTADPANQPMTSQQWSQSKQNGNRHLLNSMMQGFQENGTSLEYSESTKDSCRNVLNVWSSTLSDCQVPRKAIKKAEMALLSSEDDAVRKFSASGNGLHMVFDENGKEIEIGIMSQHGIEKNNVDLSALRNRGYLPTEINGETYYAFYTERISEGDEISKKLHRQNI